MRRENLSKPDIRREAISTQGLAVLGAVRQAANGQLPIPAVLRAVHRAGTRPAVARASLSRTLRRLWRAGLVELVDEAGRTLTGEVHQRQRWAALARAEPEAAYQAYVARRRAEGTPLAYRTAAARRGPRWRTAPPPSTWRRGGCPPSCCRRCACSTWC
jgi:hypothetical protein